MVHLNAYYIIIGVNKIYTEIEHLTAKCNPRRYFQLQYQSDEW